MDGYLLQTATRLYRQRATGLENIVTYGVKTLPEAMASGGDLP